ncbi:MAG: hypothetical protein KGJ86_21795, partial [Chloroflexota bacterium]|nr:hypothetical protein [Chloroflexota bacterium]
MDRTAGLSRAVNPRLIGLAVLALGLTVGLGLASHLTHSATIPNAGLPASNTNTIANLDQYDAQVNLTRSYLDDLAQLDYASAYQLLAPSVRASLTQEQFDEQQQAYGQLGQPTVWIDDASSTRAEFLLAKRDGSGTSTQHRFLLSREQNRWWMNREAPLQTLTPAATLVRALHAYIDRQAGSVWANTVELLRQEPFEGGQLLLFSYIEPHPQGSLVPQRLAVLSYYTNTSAGWQFSGGGTTGVPARMNLADVALGFTAFGPGDRYVAYFVVVENTNARRLTFQ